MGKKETSVGNTWQVLTITHTENFKMLLIKRILFPERNSKDIPVRSVPINVMLNFHLKPSPLGSARFVFGSDHFISFSVIYQSEF